MLSIATEKMFFAHCRVSILFWKHEMVHDIVAKAMHKTKWMNHCVLSFYMQELRFPFSGVLLGNIICIWWTHGWKKAIAGFMDRNLSLGRLRVNVCVCVCVEYISTECKMTWRNNLHLIDCSATSNIERGMWIVERTQRNANVLYVYVHVYAHCSSTFAFSKEKHTHKNHRKFKAYAININSLYFSSWVNGMA